MQSSTLLHTPLDYLASMTPSYPRLTNTNTNTTLITPLLSQNRTAHFEGPSCMQSSSSILPPIPQLVMVLWTVSESRSER